MVYRTTLTPLFSLRREMDRILEDAYGRTNQPTVAWTPAADVREDERAYLFDLELPGVAPESVEVTADQGVLSVRGERRSEARESNVGRWHIVERSQGAFRRSFQLPAQVAEDKIEAQYTNGVLTVRVPKAEVPKAKKIEVKV